MIFVYIHGANATSESFTYIREQIKGKEILIDYNSSNGFDYNLQLMINQLSTVDDIFFIAHSLGGIYALHLAHHLSTQVLGAVTLSTPYGGSREADYIKYFLPFNQLMKDVGSHSNPILKLSKITIPSNWTNIITTSGNNPWRLESNDGVVTHTSMRHFKDMELVDLPLNHYEVVVSNRTVKIIKDRIKKVKSTLETKKSVPIKERFSQSFSSYWLRLNHFFEL